MNNKLIDLNNYLFEQMERLNDDEALSDESGFVKAIERSKAVQGIASQIISNAKLALDAKRYVDEYADNSAVPEMLQIEDKK